MTNEPQSPVKDANFDLIAILKSSLEMAWTVDEYIADAEKNGDNELAEWFRKIQQSNLKAGEQGKQLLLDRLQK
ncbi:hypothetical protein [Corynebacterium halotolerans]|uniref:hypothetical protein n=1 Tax=Corynebacterium halotolerans TaxID=225326 RepID=UPI003CF4B293